MTKVGLDAIDNSTTLDSNESHLTNTLAGYREAAVRGATGTLQAVT